MSGEEQFDSGMSTPGEKPSPEAPTPLAARKPRAKRVPITTLEAFLLRRAANPSSFLKDLREADVWEFDADDVRAALLIHPKRDKDFATTTRLLAAALKERDGRFARPIVGFSTQAIRQRLADNPHFIGTDLDAAEDAEQRLDLVARALAPRIRESSRKVESTNLLLATILWLNHSEGLDPDIALDRLLTALGVQPSRTPERQRARLVWLGERPKEVRAVLDLLAPLAVRSSELSESFQRSQERADAEHERRIGAEAEVVRLSASIDDMERAVANAKTEIARLDEALRAAGVHAEHDVAQSKARVAGQLDGQLRDLVATIDEALALDPPRVEVAREKVEVIVRELERQVAWLRS